MLVCDMVVQILDGETIREWMLPAYTYPDGTGFGHPWELMPVENYTLLTKAGVINGYNAEMQFSVSDPRFLYEKILLSHFVNIY